MTGTNHALTGALIAGVVGNPIVFVPLALSSHFVLDSLPHFGEDYKKRTKLSSGVWVTDAILLAAGLGVLTVTSNWLIMIGAFAAISPDLAWIFRFVFAEKWGSLPPKEFNKLNAFHAGIQKFETRKGIYIEVVWFIGAAYLSSRYVL